ncbi:tectonic-3-like [Pecten maximus]|uniref:tectonic-3-like n=1 Tax=Pecten maximus TaxID=6579 RepID=UPI001458B0A2|nr:tectonic-3-like [Pecten maximus]
MAAKAKLQARACCRIYVLLFLLFSCICLTHSSTTAPTTTPAANTTTVNTTTPTTTTPTTTTPTTTTPTTTTTALPTQPPSPVAINTDIGPCPCDLTASACDVRCCCDPDCTANDIKAFSSCIPTSVNVDDRMCIQSELLLMENTQYTKEYTQDGLFCIYFDNNAQRNYYANPDLVSDTTTFENYLYRFADTNYQPGAVDKTLYANEYKSGDPVFVVYQNLARGYLGVPKAVGSTFCSDSNPAAFLEDESSQCVRNVYTLDANTCVDTVQWKASSYYSGIKVVTTPYLFNWIVNQTGVTNPAVTTAPPPTTTAPVVTTDINATTSVSNTTTPSVVTTASTVVTTTDNSTVTSPSPSNTTDNVTTTPPVPTTPIVLIPVDLYNNTYTVPITVDSVTCQDVNGQALTCPTNSPIDPTYTSGTCSNVVLGVEYILGYGSGIPEFLEETQQVVTSARVRLTLGNINQASLPITQKYSAKFEGASEANVVEKSGNPGYLVGKPVRAGVRYNIAGNSSFAVSESLYDLTLVKSTGSGDCATGSANRIQVNFGEDVRTGCLIRFNYDNVTEYCSAIEQQIITALEGLDGVTYDPGNRSVAIFGNSDPLVTGDWVPIIRNAPTAAQCILKVCTEVGRTFNKVIVIFLQASEANVVEKSGNPGYLVGKPVRAGVRYNIAGNSSFAVSESLYDLTLVKSTGSGDCATGSANRLQVNFGEDVRTGCLIRFNYDNVTEYCSAIEQQIITALEGLDGVTYEPGNRSVAIFGNSDPLVTGDWVPIIRNAPTAAQVVSTISGPTCSVTTGMHVQILYANIGALNNPQRKILGVQFNYEEPQLVTFKCIGVFCSPGSSALTQSVEISQSVTFIDVSEPSTGYVGEPPIFLAKLPYDFFYPFLQSAGQRAVSSSVLLVTLLCVVKLML